MPEYLTTGDPSPRISRHIVNWLSDETLYRAKVEEMERLAIQYARPGATDRAADYILAQIRENRRDSESSTSWVPDNMPYKTKKPTAA